MRAKLCAPVMMLAIKPMTDQFHLFLILTMHRQVCQFLLLQLIRSCNTLFANFETYGFPGADIVSRDLEEDSTVH